MSVDASPFDRAMMRRALDLAGRGWGRVHPNPLVGAVVVHGSEVVGEGYHAEYGGPHAEVAALDAAGDRAHGATLYVTLEPCSHHGKTPPCTDAIVAAGVRRVVIAAEDPHSRAAGGAERLRRAGVEVTLGVEREAARSQNAIFMHAHERGTPFVSLKYALSLDARLSETAGRPSAVTGPAANAETHRLRAGYDAIMVGIGTALADDPLLTVRGEVEPRVPPTRIVLDSRARLPVDSRLARTVDVAPVLVVCGADAPAERTEALEAVGVAVERVGAEAAGSERAEVEAEAAAGPEKVVTTHGAAPRPGLPIDAVLGMLAERGIRSIFCEGGGRLGSALLAADAVERMYLFYAPKLYGPDGAPAFTGPAAGTREGWRRARLAAFDEDVLIVLDRSG